MFSFSKNLIYRYPVLIRILKFPVFKPILSLRNYFNKKDLPKKKTLTLFFKESSFKFGVKPRRSIVDKNLFYNGVYELDNTLLMYENLRPDSVFIDIGANLGYYTCLFSSYLKKGLVISFEPSTQIFSALEKNLELNQFKNAKIFNLGLGKRKQVKKLYLNSKNLGGSSLNESVYKKFDNSEFETVKIENASKFILSLNLKKIDLIKIDVEGFESDVIEGLKLVLKKYSPKILVEISSQAIGNTKKTKNIFQMLEKCGYSLLKLNYTNQTNRNKLNYKNLLGDFFFVNRGKK